MKILIAIGGKEFSKPTLDLGMKIANSFQASTTIAYVGKKISQFSEKDVSVVHQNLDDRELYRPGIRTLEWAYDFLISKKYSLGFGPPERDFSPPTGLIKHNKIYCLRL